MLQKQKGKTQGLQQVQLAKALFTLNCANIFSKGGETATERHYGTILFLGHGENFFQFGGSAPLPTSGQWINY